MAIRVARSVKRVDASATELGTELLEQPEVREQFVLHRLGEFLVFGSNAG